jgi:hypothetical protein
VAVVLERAMKDEAKAESRGDAKPDEDAHEVSTTIAAADMVDPEGLPDAATQRGSRTRKGRRRLMFSGAGMAFFALLATAGVVVALTRSNAARDPWNGMTAAELEQRYDGKLPWGNDDKSRCADPPPSQVVEGASNPPVIGPEGRLVGSVQLRKSPICPTAVWARVLWNGDEQPNYKFPTGWTLHSVMHRSDTNTVIDEQDRPYASEKTYIVSRMVAASTPRSTSRETTNPT